MKTFTPSAASTLRFALAPSKPVALGFFWALAFLPAVTHLVHVSGPVINSLVGMGPVAAGFWLAAAICETGLNLALLGAVFSLLIGLVNWLMLAGGDCCSIGG